ncbi:MAG: acyl carrier protein [Cytophagales bacterium]|jgi:acyl carrier protein|nr:acyl carrier protein [Cytophagales bacterium]
MGLDSVELIIEFEKRFQVEIPDIEWEQAATVGQVAEKVKQYKTLKPIRRDLFSEIYNKTLATLHDLYPEIPPISQKTLLKDVFQPENLNHQWNEFENRLGLKIPSLNKADFGAKSSEIVLFGIVWSRLKPPFLASSIGRLVDCICGLNYKQFIDFENISSDYEIIVAVCGITHETCGVSIEEIYPNSSFTNDLGLD